MTIEKDLEKTLEFNPEKVSQCYEDLIKIFQKYKLTAGEIIIAYGNLGYALGASIEDFKDKGPGVKELERLYYEKPTLGVSLMLNGITITTWFDNYTDQKLGKNKDI